MRKIIYSKWQIEKSEVRSPKSKDIGHWTLDIGRFFLLLTTFYSLLSTSCLYAVPHINGKNPGPKEYVHQPAVSPGAGVKSFAIARAVAASGTRKIAVILVNFASAGDKTSGGNMMSTLDIVGFNDTFNYLRDFYTEASYGKLNLDITFFCSTCSVKTLAGETPFQLSNLSMSSYGADTESSLSQLVIDALNKTGDKVKHTSAGGVYDGVMVAHAGYGNESTDPTVTAGDIWSAYIGTFTKTNGFTEGTIVPAKEGGGASPIGVTCHEFGHHLGLWDLYSTVSSGGTTQVGDWSLMDNGAWLGSPAGSHPSHPSAWEKQKIGWLDFIEVSSGTNNLNSYSFETSPSTVYKVKMMGTETEYFVVCFTSKTARSPSNPGTGLLIWHIDEGDINGVTFKARMDKNALNNYAHRTIDLEEADTTDPSKNKNEGDSTDPWPGTRINFTVPYSNSYQDQPSMVTITEIKNYTDYSNFKLCFKPFLSGYIRDSAGIGIKDVNITANSSGGATMVTVPTDSSGNYFVTDLDPTSYTITPSKTGWHFFPSELAIAISTYSLTNNNFNGVVDKTFSLVNKNANTITPVRGPLGTGNNITTVYYKISNSGRVVINLYTFDGRLVKTLVDATNPPGMYSIQWNGKNDSDEMVSSGIYLLHISAPGYKETKKICVIR